MSESDKKVSIQVTEGKKDEGASNPGASSGSQPDALGGADSEQVTSKDPAPIGATVEGELRKQPSDRASPAGALGGPASPSLTQTDSDALALLRKVVHLIQQDCYETWNRIVPMEHEIETFLDSTPPTVSNMSLPDDFKMPPGKVEYVAPADSFVWVFIGTNGMPLAVEKRDHEPTNYPGPGSWKRFSEAIRPDNQKGDKA